MLPAAHRLRRSRDIARVTRAGVRARRGAVVVHLDRRPNDGQLTSAGPRIGLAVGKSVGGSVARHRVARRLRAISRDLLADLPGQVDVVIRAMPTAAQEEYTTLDHDLRDAIRAAVAKAGLR